MEKTNSTLLQAINNLYLNSQITLSDEVTFEPNQAEHLYLWAMLIGDNQMEIMPSTEEEIEDSGVCTREITVLGTEVIIAEDF